MGVGIIKKKKNCNVSWNHQNNDFSDKHKYSVMFTNFQCKPARYY